MLLLLPMMHSTRVCYMTLMVYTPFDNRERWNGFSRRMGRHELYGVVAVVKSVVVVFKTVSG